MGYDWKAITRQEQQRLLARQKRLESTAPASEKAFLSIVNRLCQVYNQHQRVLKYRTQEPYYLGAGISFYVDVYFPKFHVGVEIDGPWHSRERHKIRDAWRSKVILKTRKDLIIRFKNREVEAEPLQVAGKLMRALLNHPHATPSYQRSLARYVQLCSTQEALMRKHRIYLPPIPPPPQVRLSEDRIYELDARLDFLLGE